MTDISNYSGTDVFSEPNDKPLDATYCNQGSCLSILWQSRKLEVIDVSGILQDPVLSLQEAIVEKGMKIQSVAFRSTKLDDQSAFKTTEIAMVTEEGSVEIYDLFLDVFCTAMSIKDAHQVAYSRKGNLMAVSTKTGEIIVFRNGRKCMENSVPSYLITRMVFNANGKVLSACNDAGEFMRFLAKNGNLQTIPWLPKIIEEESPGYAFSYLDCHPKNPNMVALSGTNNLVYIFDLHKGDFYSTESWVGKVNKVTFLENGILAILGKEGVHCISVVNGELIEAGNIKSKTHGKNVEPLAITFAGRQLQVAWSHR